LDTDLRRFPGPFRLGVIVDPTFERGGKNKDLLVSVQIGP
jgi:hypothetical protein